MNWLYDIGHSLWLGSNAAPKGQVLYATPGRQLPALIQSDRLPPLSEHILRIVCLSDTHEQHGKIDVPPGDVLIVAGDVLLINRHFSTPYSMSKLESVARWLQALPHQHKIIIGGNHDRVMETVGAARVRELFARVGCTYLEDNRVKITCNCDKGRMAGHERAKSRARSPLEGSETSTSAVPSPVPEKHESSDGKKGHSVALSVYGSPVSRGSSANDAFQSNAEERIAHLAPCDILVTHAPLSSQVVKTIAPLVHVYGHIHERYGISHVPVRVNNKTRSIISVCASIMDRRYHPSHSPIVVDIPVKSVTGR